MANGAAVGGFMSGLLGGASMANSFQKSMPPVGGAAQPAATAQPASDKVGFGLGQPLVSGEAGSAQIAGEQETGWGALKKIISSFEPATQPAAQKTMGTFIGTQETPNV